MTGNALHKNFVERVKQHHGNAIHLVRTFDDRQRACWFLMRANSLQLLKLQHTASAATIDLTQYGEVVASGWGHTPDPVALRMVGAEA
jgi:hypothetical protein